MFLLIYSKNVIFPGNNQYISASDAASSDTFSFKSSQSLWPSSVSQSSSDCDTRSTPPLPKVTVQQTRRNMGGRKPAKDINCSPEEEERRRVRRERNKAAAARCRKRRVDHTNSLIMVGIRKTNKTFFYHDTVSCFLIVSI